MAEENRDLKEKNDEADVFLSAPKMRDNSVPLMSASPGVAEFLPHALESPVAF